MSFNFFMTKRVFRVGQYDGIDDFVAFDLSGKKRTLGEFLVGKFHSSAICKRFDPLVAHSAPQVAIQSPFWSPCPSVSPFKTDRLRDLGSTVILVPLCLGQRELEKRRSPLVQRLRPFGAGIF